MQEEKTIKLGTTSAAAAAGEFTAANIAGFGVPLSQIAAQVAAGNMPYIALTGTIIIANWIALNTIKSITWSHDGHANLYKHIDPN